MELNYCRRCGVSLTRVNGVMFRCKNDHVIFRNPSPAVGLFLFDGDELLLSVRGEEPNKGTLDCFGGFLDGEETFEQALVREMREELGLEPSDYSSPIYLTSATSHYEYSDEQINVVSVIYYARLNTGAVPKAGDDVAAIHRAKLADISADDIGNDDVRAGLIALQGIPVRSE